MSTSHDERIAIANQLMRAFIAPSLPADTGALLVVFEVGRPGLLTYISTAERAGCREMLRKLLAKWDEDARAAEGRP